METLEGKLLSGDYSTRRLREFLPREEMELATEQKNFKRALKEREQELQVKRGEEVASEATEQEDGDKVNKGSEGEEREESEGENNIKSKI